MEMLAVLSGRSHWVHTAVAVANQQECAVKYLPEVVFREISSQECKIYWETGEPIEKAGGYAIQGYGARICRVFFRELQRCCRSANRTHISTFAKVWCADLELR